MMAHTQKKDTKVLQDIDLDALLSKLSEAEIDELNAELGDPDDSMVNPADRCRYKTDKVQSAPFDRQKLVEHLEKKAMEDKDWEEAKPYSKETRGKVWQPKEEEEKVRVQDKEKIQTEWDELLDAASEEDLVELAAVMGFHGMLNQDQYHQAFIDDSDASKKARACQGIAKADPVKSFSMDPPNNVDAEESLKRVKANDAKLKELNLNNVKGVNVETLIELAEALNKNTHLEKLYLSNTRATDKVATALASSLANNKTLKLLNVESNYLTAQGIISLLEAINLNQVMTEFRVSNQRPQVLGVRSEMTIAQLMRDNTSLLNFGIVLEIHAARVLVSQSLQRNNDNLRRARMGKEIILPPSADDTSK